MPSFTVGILPLVRIIGGISISKFPFSFYAGSFEPQIYTDERRSEKGISDFEFRDLKLSNEVRSLSGLRLSA